jgi:uncharacterized membrane protein YphA (DoxX/SURF4 family)
MKIVVNTVRVLVGILFIFSGLVKANDPLGLSYKMKEFFEIWNMELEHSSFFLRNGFISLFQFLHEHSLGLAVFMIAFEIIAGVALLLGWRMRLFSWLLLLLIIFFTFLTGYAYLSGKFTNCGCFGDCLPISSRTSFIKDILLTIMIIFLFAYRKKIRPSLSPAGNAVVMIAALILSFGIQWYALSYLPLVDCLPFKKGNNLNEKIIPAPDAKPDVYETKLIYEKNGKRYAFTVTDLPADWKTYKYISTESKLTRKGNMDPEIKGFSLKTASGVDSTDIVLNEPRSLILFCENFSEPVSNWEKDFQQVIADATKKNIPVHIVTASAAEAGAALQNTSLKNVSLLECDFTAIRTAARTNPCLYYLEKGVVKGKWSYRKMKAAIQMIKNR